MEVFNNGGMTSGFGEYQTHPISYWALWKHSSYLLDC
jgi:hypothetical protein